MTLGAAWVLYNVVYSAGQLAPGFGTGSSGYLSFITIGNAFYVFVFAAAFVVGRVMFWERATGTIEATFMSPMSRLAYMTGIMVAAATNSDRFRRRVANRLGLWFPNSRVQCTVVSLQHATDGFRIVRNRIDN